MNYFLFIQYIIIFILGLLIGNFVTTIYYRLPKNIIIYGFNEKFSKPPFCSNCNHPLRFYEYLPILGWLTNGGKCNYCLANISFSYTIIEIACSLLAIYCFYSFKNNPDLFILVFLLGISIILGIAIYITYNIIPLSITTSIILEAIIFHALYNQTIIYTLSSLCFATIFCLILLRKDNLNYRNQPIKIPLILILTVLLLPFLMSY
ncbi:MAG: prepilin peptidase [Rickettsiaceae bacterium]|nr:prepilin peptidase [Rickettsiaceae bacterium]